MGSTQWTQTYWNCKSSVIMATTTEPPGACFPKIFRHYVPAWEREKKTKQNTTAAVHPSHNTSDLAHLATAALAARSEKGEWEHYTSLRSWIRGWRGFCVARSVYRPTSRCDWHVVLCACRVRPLFFVCPCLQHRGHSQHVPAANSLSRLQISGHYSQSRHVWQLLFLTCWSMDWNVHERLCFSC